MINFLFKIFLSFVLLQTALLSQEINIDKIIKDSYKSNKKVIVYLHRIGCSYCNSMQEFTLDEDDVKEYIEKNYTFISVNVSHDDTITYKGKTTGGNCFAKAIGFAFYPTVLFLDKEANVEFKTLGYRDEYEFLIILDYVNKHLTKSSSLKAYKKEIGFTKDLENEIKDDRDDAR